MKRPGRSSASNRLSISGRGQGKPSPGTGNRAGYSAFCQWAKDCHFCFTIPLEKDEGMRGKSSSTTALFQGLIKQPGGRQVFATGAVLRLADVGGQAHSNVGIKLKTSTARTGTSETEGNYSSFFSRTACFHHAGTSISLPNQELWEYQAMRYEANSLHLFRTSSAFSRQ